MVGEKQEASTITNKLYFRDNGLSIDGLEDGYLNLYADTYIRLSGNITVPGSKDISITDSDISTGTGDITIAGPVATTQPITLTAAQLKFSLNDGIYSSGLKGTVLFSGSAFPSAAGWIRCDVGGVPGYIPVFSGCYVIGFPGK